MTIYIVTFSLSIGLYLLLSKIHIWRALSTGKNQIAGMRAKRAILPFVVSAAPLILVSGFRYNVGTDYFATYYTGFYRVLIGDNFDKFELGYMLLVRIVQVFTNNVFVLFFVTSLITVGFTFAAFRRMSTNVGFSILLFMISRYFFIGMNGVRQMMACAVFAYALRFAIKRKVKPYLVFSLVAVSFHYSTILLLPTYWLMCVNWSPKKTVILLVVTTILSTSAFPLMAAVVPAASKLGRILNGYQVAGKLFTFGTITLNIYLLFLYYRLYKYKKRESWYKCFLYLQIVAVAATLLLPSVPSIERVYWSFSFPSIICLPGILKALKPQWVNLLATGIVVIVFTAYTAYDIGVLKDHMVVPYDSIIEYEPVPSTEFTYRQTHGLDRWER